VQVLGEKTLLLQSPRAEEAASADGLTQHLLLLPAQRSVHLVTTAGPAAEPGAVVLSVRPAIPRACRGAMLVRDLGYIGSYTAELGALIELSTQPAHTHSPVLQSVLQPQRDVSGDYVRRPLRVNTVPINASQRDAVESLQHALEKIQGPPGTGKSTTIFHIITGRLPPDARVLVTCSRNVAVESIAQKLYDCAGPSRLCVFGNASRIGATARSLLLDAQCERHPRVQKLVALGSRLALLAEQIQRGWRLQLNRGVYARSQLWRRAWEAFCSRRWRVTTMLGLMCGELGRNAAAVAEAEAREVRSECLLQARIWLCTIASSSRLLREYDECTGTSGQLRVHTAIIDECGCTPESSVGLLLRLQLRNLILVGDHKQLPPTSLVPPSELGGTGHTRSLLERCILASGSMLRLTTQYRMHPEIGQLVSELFYHSLLRTDSNCAAERLSHTSGGSPLLWVDVGSGNSESVPDRSKSIQNLPEATAVCAVVTCLRQRHGPKAQIAVLTFYKGQLLELMRSLAAALRVEVLTVDACQGSEFEFVVLSTCRSNRSGKLGFVKDRQRMCVAISRAMRQMVVVGDATTLTNDESWRILHSRCQQQRPSQWKPADTSGAEGPSVLQALAAEKQAAASEASAASALALMRHQPSLQGSAQHGRSHRPAACSHNKALPDRSARGKCSAETLMEQSSRPEEIRFDQRSFPSLGAITASSRTAQQQSTTVEEGTPADTTGWAVSRELLEEMFGTAASPVLARFGGDVQRAFVVLLEMGAHDDNPDEADTSEDEIDWDIAQCDDDGWQLWPEAEVQDALAPASVQYDVPHVSPRNEQRAAVSSRMSANSAAFVPAGPSVTRSSSTSPTTNQTGSLPTSQNISTSDRNSMANKVKAVLSGGGGRTTGATQNRQSQQQMSAYEAHIHKLQQQGLAAEAHRTQQWRHQQSEPQSEVEEPPPPQQEELRIDPVDGQEYSQSDFIEEYGGTTEWDAAAPATMGETGTSDDSDASASVVDRRLKRERALRSSHEREQQPQPGELWVAKQKEADAQMQALQALSRFVETQEQEVKSREQAEKQLQERHQRHLEEMGFDSRAVFTALQAHASVEAATAWLLSQSEHLADELALEPEPEPLLPHSEPPEHQRPALRSETAEQITNELLHEWVAAGLLQLGLEDQADTLGDYFYMLLENARGVDENEELVELVVEMSDGVDVAFARHFVEDAPNAPSTRDSSPVKVGDARTSEDSNRQRAPLRVQCTRGDGDAHVSAVSWQDPDQLPWSS
jgi:hypothetical protein